MDEEIEKLLDIPPPPAISSYYGSEKETEKLERQITEIMARENCSRERATQILQLTD